MFDIVTRGTRYEFGFSIGSKRIESEWLFSYPEGKRRRLYERTGSEFSFSRLFAGNNRIVADLTRENSLFLSAAIGKQP